MVPLNPSNANFHPKHKDTKIFENHLNQISYQQHKG